VGADWSAAAGSGSGSAPGGTAAGSGSASGGRRQPLPESLPTRQWARWRRWRPPTLALVLTLVLTHGSKQSRPTAKAAPTPAQKNASPAKHQAAQVARRHPLGGAFGPRAAPPLSAA
jgi:hypothetical protein